MKIQSATEYWEDLKIREEEHEDIQQANEELRNRNLINYQLREDDK